MDPLLENIFRSLWETDWNRDLDPDIRERNAPMATLFDNTLKRLIEAAEHLDLDPRFLEKLKNPLEMTQA
ncbi:hypothetical protein, partial [Rhizobium leguminosarum]|uniref:hypothetical protein n=1 Tax=Rhizobium leguminosarum TaxID=384 RepID=UPI001ECFF4F6|nr:hypothetical protein [Rhizobium leguminosarum]